MFLPFPKKEHNNQKAAAAAASSAAPTLEHPVWCVLSFFVRQKYADDSINCMPSVIDGFTIRRLLFQSHCFVWFLGWLFPSCLSHPWSGILNLIQCTTQPNAQWSSYIKCDNKNTTKDNQPPSIVCCKNGTRIQTIMAWPDIKPCWWWDWKLNAAHKTPALDASKLSTFLGKIECEIRKYLK